MSSLIGTMYQTAGLRDNENMSYADFSKIFASDEYAKTLEKASLGVDSKFFIS